MIVGGVCVRGGGEAGKGGERGLSLWRRYVGEEEEEWVVGVRRAGRPPATHSPVLSLSLLFFLFRHRKNHAGLSRCLSYLRAAHHAVALPALHPGRRGRVHQPGRRGRRGRGRGRDAIIDSRHAVARPAPAPVPAPGRVVGVLHDGGRAGAAPAGRHDHGEGRGCVWGVGFFFSLLHSLRPQPAPTRPLIKKHTRKKHRARRPCRPLPPRCTCWARATTPAAPTARVTQSPALPPPPQTPWRPTWPPCRASPTAAACRPPSPAAAAARREGRADEEEAGRPCRLLP